MPGRRINGKDLGQYMNKNVIVIGKIINVNSSRTSVEIQTPDDVNINVNLPKPLPENAEGYVEIRGTAQSKTTMNCSNYVHFAKELDEDFEPKKYSEFLTVFNVIGDRNWRTSENDEAYIQ